VIDLAPASPHLYSARRLRVIILLVLLLLLPLAVTAVVLAGVYHRYRVVVDQRLAGERWSGPSALYSRPLRIRPGFTMTADRLAQRLNALRYDESRDADPGPGQFTRREGSITFHPRAAAGAQAEGLRVTFDRDHVGEIQGLHSQRRYDDVELERELITYLFDGERAKRRHVGYDELPPHLVHCVLAAEDRRFFHHPGVDVFRTVAAAVRNLEAESYLQGGSTITQQLVKNFFLTPEKTIRRKLQEALLAFVLERRAAKREILELYLNEVYLGQVGSFGVHGVGEAARIYFQKDVGNLSLSEAAFLAGIIHSPNRYNPHRHLDDARERRNVVLRSAREAGFLPADRTTAAAAEPLRVAGETVDISEAPYFVDYVKSDLRRTLGSHPANEGLEIQTTLDPYLQSVAQDVLAAGLARAEESPRAKRRRDPPPAGTLQGALIVLDPTTGAVLALVGGRSYEASQFNRATDAVRQPGSTFKPFVYLTAFEATFDQPDLPPLTPATLVEDAPATFFTEQGPYAPSNDGQRYLGFVTLRRALAMSLNVATLKVADVVGYQRIATLFSRVVGRPVKPYPSMALGTFEVTPLEMAAAYAAIAAGGVRVQPTVVTSVRNPDGRELFQARVPAPERVARPESAFLVTSMLRSVINEGTASRARALGFKAEAAGKTGTTDDTRDAWFIGFTPDLLCAVWVGYDDNTPLRLSGSEAALPIWTEFMKRATVGAKPKGFRAPPGVAFADIDRESGLLATPSCPRVLREAFIAGAVPVDHCLWHNES
jgi:penicillin-binding protein 1B